MSEEIQPIRKLDQLSEGDVVEVFQMNRLGPYVVGSVKKIPRKDRQVVLHPIHCPECPEDQIDFQYKRVVDAQLPGGDVILTKMNKQNYIGWKYVGVKKV